MSSGSQQDGGRRRANDETSITTTTTKMTGDGYRREGQLRSTLEIEQARTATFSLANEDHECGHDHEGIKDYFSCSSSSAALSSTRSPSSASGLSDSPARLRQSFGQAFTPLSMGDSEMGAEDREAAIRKSSGAGHLEARCDAASLARSEQGDVVTSPALAQQGSKPFLVAPSGATPLDPTLRNPLNPLDSNSALAENPAALSSKVDADDGQKNQNSQAPVLINDDLQFLTPTTTSSLLSPLLTPTETRSLAFSDNASLSNSDENNDAAMGKKSTQAVSDASGLCELGQGRVDDASAGVENGQCSCNSHVRVGGARPTGSHMDQSAGFTCKQEDMHQSSNLQGLKSPDLQQGHHQRGDGCQQQDSATAAPARLTPAQLLPAQHHAVTATNSSHAAHAASAATPDEIARLHSITDADKGRDTAAGTVAIGAGAGTDTRTNNSTWSINDASNGAQPSNNSGPLGATLMSQTKTTGSCEQQFKDAVADNNATTSATPGALNPARPGNSSSGAHNQQYTPEDEPEHDGNLVSPFPTGFSPPFSNNRSSSYPHQQHQQQQGGHPHEPNKSILHTSLTPKNNSSIDAASSIPGTIIAPLAVSPADSYPSTPSSSSPSTQSLVSQQHLSQETSNYRPLVRTTSDNLSLKIQHPTPDINPKTGAYLGNIAQLEATAERLSTATSSIEDAIRDLHAELKRSDSQRSAAARARAGQNLEFEDGQGFEYVDQEDDGKPQLRLRRPALLRHLSASASIASLNSISRVPPYTPSRTRSNASLKKPLRYRNRSGSLNTTMQPQHDYIRSEAEPYLSRTGPGKGSVRSVRTGKLSLAEIVESEPIALNQSALDNADRNPFPAEEDDDTIRGQAAYDDITPVGNSFPPPSTDAFHSMLDGGGLELPGSDLRFDPAQHHHDQPSVPGPAYHSHDQYHEHYHQHLQHLHEEPRPRSSGSGTSSMNVRNAFGDFDGVHFEPELHSPPIVMQPPAPQPPVSPPRAVRSPTSPSMARPTSYMDPQTGQEMLYYPARVPAMLNLPPKLSRKPKSAARNARQSELLSAMPEISRKSAAWLPDPLEGHANKTASWLPDPLEGHANAAFSPPLSPDASTGDTPGALPPPESPFAATGLPTPAFSAPEIHVTETGGFEPRYGDEYPGVTSNILPAPADGDDEVKPAVPRPRKGRAVTDAEATKSRLSKLPPQLRASVFFDLPSTSAKLKVKDGSASATLDHLLNASANAPVSAFTDHLIVGKLGSEVYGPEKKRKSGMPKTSSDSDPKKRNTYLRDQKSADTLNPDSRSSVLSPGSGSHHGSSTLDGADDEPLPPGAVGYATLSPDTDEFDPIDRRSNDSRERGEDGEEGEEEEEEEYDELYHGPPTTLLAELQIRKQQQKNRTRLLANPNGMHSTLLEMDAVAEAQRRNRKDKRVNLAWEDPVQDGILEDDDEDVPLGVLYAAKATGANNLAAAAAELDRPLGLMERRELEENEPLSQRRARLQGGDRHQSAILTKRQTLMMNVGSNRLSQMPQMSMMAPMAGPLAEEQEVSDEEAEGETLGERMRRLKNKEEGDSALPRARPVSTAFTSELLGQFVPPEEEVKEEAAKPVGEEEETLGQRRRRLQAEREARAAEMGIPGVRTASGAPPGHRLSMAGILSAHPRNDTSLQDAERRRFDEDMRIKREQDEKMAAMRSQMPTTLLTPSGGNSTGGFRNGQFNDGTGGFGTRRVPSQGNLSAEFASDSWNRSSVAFNNGGMIQQAGMTSMKNTYGPAPGGAPGWYGGQAPMYMGGPMQMGGGMPGMNAPSMGMQMPMQMQMQMPMSTPMQMPMQMHMGQQPMASPMGMGGGYQANPQGQTDMVDRWRHGVM